MSDDKNILSIDYDDDNKNYQAFDEFLQDDTKRKKNKSANEIEQIGDQLLKEIERKKKEKQLKAKKLIPYILKNCDGKYDEEELYSYSFEDVKDLYDNIKAEKSPLIVKIFRFLFNI
jgi:hypothetical protein